MSKAQENPILSAVTAVTALLAGLNAFVGSFGWPPFWSDVTVSTVILYTVGHWSHYIYREYRKKETIFGLDNEEKKKPPIKDVIKKILPVAVILPVLLIVLVWNVIPIAKHFSNTHWSVCGNFSSPCGKDSCLRFYDSRKRLLSSECYGLDDSEYIKYEQSNWWTYKPEAVSVQCDKADSEPTRIEQPMFDSTCEGRMRVR